VMFWYGFEPVVNYSVKPLTSVGGYLEGTLFGQTFRNRNRVQ